MMLAFRKEVAETMTLMNMASNGQGTSSPGLEQKMKALAEEYGIGACRQSLESLSTAQNECQINDAIVDASFDGVFLVNSKGIIQRCNPSALEMFGYVKTTELVGENISVAIGGKHAANHQSHFDKPLELDGHVFKNMRDVPARRKDGSEFRVTVGLSVIETAQERCYVAFVRDLTEEKMHLQEMEHEHQLHQAIIDASFDSIFVADCFGVIKTVNQAALAEFGYNDRSDLVGQPITKIMPSQYAEKHDGFMKNFRNRDDSKVIGMADRELSAVRSDGSEFPIRIGIQLVKADAHNGQLLVGFIRNITQEKKAMELAIEKRAAEELLLNMLPEEVALRLRGNPSHIADHYPSATILFADIVGFTHMSGSMEPIAVVQLLNDLFTRFDNIVERYGLNKVKTIGDCYMVTSIPGHYDPTATCAAVTHFGLDMMEALQAYNMEHPERPLELRVGINCGPVVAGVVGTKRFLYDLWGDTVNMASRMESTGVPGQIQVTQAVVTQVPANEFRFESRGLVHVKGKGDMETFFLRERLKDRSAYFGVFDK